MILKGNVLAQPAFYSVLKLLTLILCFRHGASIAGLDCRFRGFPAGCRDEGSFRIFICPFRCALPRGGG